MPITTVFQSLAKAAGASASVATRDAPSATDFQNFEPINSLPCLQVRSRDRAAEQSGSGLLEGNPGG